MQALSFLPNKKAAALRALGMSRGASQAAVVRFLQLPAGGLFLAADEVCVDTGLRD